MSRRLQTDTQAKERIVSTILEYLKETSDPQDLIMLSGLLFSISKEDMDRGLKESDSLRRKLFSIYLANMQTINLDTIDLAFPLAEMLVAIDPQAVLEHLKTPDETAAYLYLALDYIVGRWQEYAKDWPTRAASSEQMREFTGIFRRYQKGLEYLPLDGKEFTEAEILPHCKEDGNVKLALGIADELSEVARAMARTPRHLFMPSVLKPLAYLDRPIPIGFGQTISQPILVAKMISLLDLKPEDHVLEIGMGSGYVAAILSELASEVYAIEIIPQLAQKAQRIIRRLGRNNVHCIAGDGGLGWPGKAELDAIIISAAIPVPPRHLIDQLKEGGKIVAPVGAGTPEEKCTLTLFIKEKRGLKCISILDDVAFVPVVGEGGYPQGGPQYFYNPDDAITFLSRFYDTYRINFDGDPAIEVSQAKERLKGLRPTAKVQFLFTRGMLTGLRVIHGVKPELPSGERPTNGST